MIWFAGFNIRETQVFGLNAYREYTVSVLSYTYNESNYVYATNGMNVATVTTLPSGEYRGHVSFISLCNKVTLK